LFSKQPGNNNPNDFFPFDGIPDEILSTPEKKQAMEKASKMLDEVLSTIPKEAQANFLKVFNPEAVQDPTALEQEDAALQKKYPKEYAAIEAICNQFFLKYIFKN
jgi:hypothetical protein